MKAASFGLFLSLLLILSLSCSKRTRQVRNVSVDSLAESHRHISNLDTSKRGTYTRFIGYYPVAKLKSGQAPFNPFQYNGVVVDAVGSDSARWSPAAFVEYLKMLERMDSIPELAPFYYERWTSEQKGLSSSSDTSSKRQVKKISEEKITERKPDMSLKFGLALIALAIVLIIFLSPRKPKQ